MQLVLDSDLIKTHRKRRILSS